MSDIDKFIKEISDDLKPVKKMQPPEVRAAIWMLVGFSYVAILPMFLHLRYDIDTKTEEPIFILELLIAGLGSITCCLAASYLAVPDSYQKPRIKWFSLAPFLVLTLILALQLIEQSKTNIQINTTSNTYQCFADMFAFAAFPVLAMILLARKGATTNQRWSGAMISLSAVNFSYIALRIIEPNDEADHILIWHYMPMLLMIIIGISLGRKFLKW